MTDNFTFTKSLKRLKEVVEELNKGDIELEKALRLYEEGMHLHKSCLKKLNETKLKFKELNKNGEEVTD